MRRLGSIAKKAGASPSVLARRGHQARTTLSETQQRFKLGELIQAYDSKCASHLSFFRNRSGFEICCAG